MPWFKKSKKSRQPSQQLALGIPTHIAVGPLGLNADLDPNAGSEGKRNPAIDGTDLTTVAGLNSGRTSSIIHRDSVNRRLDSSSTSTPTSRHEDVITRGRIVLQLMDPMLMILAAVNEHGVTSHDPSKEPGHAAHDLHSTDPQSEAQDRGEREDQGAVADRPSEASPERVPGDDRVDEDAHDTVQSGKPRGEHPSPGALAWIEPN